MHLDFVQFTALGPNTLYKQIAIKYCLNKVLSFSIQISLSEPVTIVSFTQDTVSVGEGDGILTLSVERFGDTESHIVVLVATVPSKSTATGMHTCV